MELNRPKRLLIFASGSGSNAENLIHFFRQPENSKVAEIIGIICNNPQAGVIQRSDRLNVPLHLITKEAWNDIHSMRELIQSQAPDLIVLAGFLKQFPGELIELVHGRVINLHPALLPKFGGKGMYGMNVHSAVIEQRESVSGITIHWVNEHYDEGNIIEQFSCTVTDLDSPDSLAEKIHQLEFSHFPETVKQVVLGLS